MRLIWLLKFWGVSQFKKNLQYYLVFPIGPSEKLTFTHLCTMIISGNGIVTSVTVKYGKAQGPASKSEQRRNLKRATMDIELKRYCASWTERPGALLVFSFPSTSLERKNSQGPSSWDRWKMSRLKQQPVWQSFNSVPWQKVSWQRPEFTFLSAIVFHVS